jgi:hypothetical protein
LAHPGLAFVGRLADEILGKRPPGRAVPPAAARGPAAGAAEAMPLAPLPVQAGGEPPAGQDVGRPGAETALAPSGLARLAALASRLAERTGTPTLGPQAVRQAATGDGAEEPGSPGTGLAAAGRAAVSGMAASGSPQQGAGGSGAHPQAGQSAPPRRGGASPHPREEGVPAAGPRTWGALPPNDAGAPLDAAGLAELVNEALVEQARRHGVDLS